MLASETIAQYLVDAGAEVHFGVVGEGNVAIVSSLQERGVAHHYSRREDAAVSMADGWFRRTGTTGFCSVTQGPGFTNTITSLIEAVKHRSQLVMLTGDTPANDIDNAQRVRTESLVRDAGAGWCGLRGVEYLADDLAAAIRKSAVERRPYVVGVPTELLYLSTDALYDHDVLPEALAKPPLAAVQRTAPDITALTRVVDLLANSKRPMILAGRGAVQSGARTALEKLADLLHAPLATTLLARGLLAGSQWNIGVSGSFSTREGARIVQQADLVLAFGSSLNTWTTMHGTLIERARIVQFDIDPHAFGDQIDVAVIGDVMASASSLVEECMTRGVGERQWAVGSAVFGLSGEPQPDARAGLPRPIDVAQVLQPLLPSDAVLAFDSGHCVMDAVTRWEVPDPSQFIFPIHSGSIGLGLGTAMGACLADTSRWTIFTTGDCGLMMSLQELDTVRRLKLPLIILVLDDNAAGAEIHYCRARGLPTEIAYTESPDFSALAAAFGFDAHTVQSANELATVFTSVVEGPRRPVMITTKIDSDEMNDWYRQLSAGVEQVRGWGGA